MTKIRAKLKLIKDPNRGWVLILIDPNGVKAQALDKFIKNDTIVSMVLDCDIFRPKQEKTLSQLGYLHAAVWPVFYQYYRDQGEIIETDQQMEKVRDEVKAAIGFIDKLTTEHIGVKGAVYNKIKSFASASKAETTEAIDKIIRLGSEYGMTVPGPDEYLKQHNAKQFE